MRPAVSVIPSSGVVGWRPRALLALKASLSRKVHCYQRACLPVPLGCLPTVGSTQVKRKKSVFQQQWNTKQLGIIVQYPCEENFNMHLRDPKVVLKKQNLCHVLGWVLKAGWKYSFFFCSAIMWTWSNKNINIFIGGGIWWADFEDYLKKQVRIDRNIQKINRKIRRVRK